MAYLHCHNCSWSQDDFYDPKGYNPAEFLKSWNDVLCGEDRHKIDEQFTDDAEFLRKNGPLTTREVVAREYEKYAKRIREMKWITWDDFRNDKEENKICPQCGSDDLDID